ncbi:MAG: SH3 domain-containing protein [Verrucomicrobiales bacterium]
MNSLSILAAALLLVPSASCLRAQKATAWEEGFREVLHVVEDKDGAANVRAAASMDSKVTGKVTSGVVVAAFSTRGDWTEIDWSGSTAPGSFMHNSRLKKLKGWKQMKVTKGHTEDMGTATYAGAEATVTAAPFVEKEHRIKKEKNGPTLVDGRSPWGVDSGLPTRSLTLAVKLDGKPVAVPAEATRDLFEPNMDSLVILTPGKPAAQLVVAMWNSDGAGGYLVAWSFVNGQYAGRTVMAP